jgi:thymidylate synthase|tara:strand:- start:347 stop:1015 length:669 start_codon:yes stop_codon:yes gene_type:complete
MNKFNFTEKNKYFNLLNNILNYGKRQKQKKGEIVYLLNQVLSFNKTELNELLNEHYKVPEKLLKSELELYMEGVNEVVKYKKQGIHWWDYCAPTMLNTYPTYFSKLPALIEKINNEKRPSKNYVLFIGETGVKTSQLPCLSLMQFQLTEDGLNLTVYQRSADSNLGLPCDLFQAYEIMKMINAPFNNLTFFIGNAHIYENNIKNTIDLITEKVKRPKFNLNV